jgi:uncharacterized protein (TIGR02147 family)
MKQVFDFKDYRTYLGYILESEGGQRSGLRSQLSKAMGCQLSYFSQVLSNKANLNAEQIERLCNYLGLTKDESLYLLTTLLRDRAGTEPLRKIYNDQLDDLLQARLVIEKRLGSTKNLKEKDKLIYYSSWHYAAIHIAVTVPELQTPESISEYFKLPLSKTNEVLSFLETAGLITRNGTRFEPGQSYMRLGNNNPHILKHHTNWRLQAVDALEREQSSDLHYSAVISLSRKDALELKDKLLKQLRENLEKVKASSEEEVYCYTIDLFKLGRSQ